MIKPVPVWIARVDDFDYDTKSPDPAYYIKPMHTSRRKPTLAALIEHTETLAICDLYGERLVGESMKAYKVYEAEVSIKVKGL